LPNFKGTLVHDCWSSYFNFNLIRHALCNAHLLRELTGVLENTNLGKFWNTVINKQVAYNRKKEP
jgi:transposase